MNAEDRLPPELVWDEDGHAGEVVLSAIADGELEIVPDQAARHVGACDVCTARLGEHALLSLDTTEALGALRPAPQRKPLPLVAIAAALVMAVLGAIPALVEVGAAPELALRALLLGSRALVRLVESAAAVDTTTWAIAWTAATVVLVVLGTLIARAAPRREAA